MAKFPFTADASQRIRRKLRYHGLRNINFSVRNKYYDSVLEEIAVNGRVRFVNGRVRFVYNVWGKKMFVSEEVSDPTWLRVCEIAQQMIDYTGDTHHVYLENVSVIAKGFGVTFYHLTMGS